MEIEKTKEFSWEEKILAAGLVIVAIVSIFIKVGFKFVLTRGLTNIIVYHRTMYPLIGGIGMIGLGYSMSRRYPKTANLILGIGSVTAILMVFILASLGGWFLFLIFSPLVCSALFAFVFTIMVFTVGGFLLAKAIENLVPEFLQMSFAARRLCLVAWITLFIMCQIVPY